MEDTPRESPRTSEHVWGWLGNLHERLKKLEEWQRRFDEPEPNERLKKLEEWQRRFDEPEPNDEDDEPEPNDEDDEPKLEEQP
jgi:hypothetical protein